MLATTLVLPPYEPQRRVFTIVVARWQDQQQQRDGETLGSGHFGTKARFAYYAFRILILSLPVYKLNQ